MNAQKARGADLESGNLIDRAKALVPILVPLFVSSFRRAYELAFAMECRCYTGGNNRTRMKQMKISFLDVVFVICMICIIAGVVLLNHFFVHLI
jgi:energy-coupling factor transport system permease protein